ncbi:MAG TPA: hypothetical protein VMT89_02935 [Candidatus Acidoferrales bacterium]|nr:hypothetical protein [Candidatus Acidoferrales bacterium]
MATTRETQLLDALDHVMRVARSSRTMSRRMRWIQERCRCAIEGDDVTWRTIDLPRSAESVAAENSRLKGRITELERLNAKQETMLLALTMQQVPNDAEEA